MKTKTKQSVTSAIMISSKALLESQVEIARRLKNLWRD